MNIPISDQWIKLYRLPKFKALVDLAEKTGAPLIKSEREVLGHDMVDLRGGVYIQGGPQLQIAMPRSVWEKGTDEIYRHFSNIAFKPKKSKSALSTTSTKGFDMSSDYDAEPRWVGISPFSVGAKKVSHSHWIVAMENMRKKHQDIFPPQKDGNFPETAMTWFEAMNFTSRLSEMLRSGSETFRLPTEAQREYVEKGRPVDLRAVMREEGVTLNGIEDFFGFALLRYGVFFTELGGKIYTMQYSEEFEDIVFSQDIPLYGFKMFASSNGRLLTDEIWQDAETADVNWGPGKIKQLAGSACEWTLDTHLEDAYKKDYPALDPVVTSGWYEKIMLGMGLNPFVTTEGGADKYRVMRGSCGPLDILNATNHFRQLWETNFAMDTLGIRLALAPLVSAANVFSATRI